MEVESLSSSAIQSTESVSSANNVSATDSFFNQSKFNINSLHCQLFWDDAAAKFICKICMKSFYNAVALQNHKNMHHDALEDNSAEGEQLFATSTMFQQTTDETGALRRRYESDTTYLLVRTRAPDNTIDALKRRRLEGLVRLTRMKPAHTFDLAGPFTCTCSSSMRPDMQCGQIFFNCCQYSLHYRSEHTKRRKAALRCQVCEQQLDRDPAPPPASPAPVAQLPPPRRSSVEHARLAHAALKPHQCSICAKRFTQQGGLQQHIRMHAGIRPFPCTYCPKAFTQKAGLDQHLRTHTKVKPFKCVICSKSFSQSVHLRQHMRTHTNIQPFACGECGRRFKQSSHLKFHTRSHAAAAVSSAHLYHPADVMRDTYSAYHPHPQPHAYPHTYPLNSHLNTDSPLLSLQSG